MSTSTLPTRRTAGRSKRAPGPLPRISDPDCGVVLLGSIASPKYVDVLQDIFGARLLFPADFVGRGDMSRGGLMLRSVSAAEELSLHSRGRRRPPWRPPSEADPVEVGPRLENRSPGGGVTEVTGSTPKERSRTKTHGGCRAPDSCTPAKGRRRGRVPDSTPPRFARCKQSQWRRNLQCRAELDSLCSVTASVRLRLLRSFVLNPFSPSSPWLLPGFSSGAEVASRLSSEGTMPAI